MGRCDEALKILDLALITCRKKNESANSVSFGNIYFSFGNVHTKRRNFEKAIDNYNKSLTVRKFRGDKVGVSLVQNEIGNMFKVIGVIEMDQARAFYSESLRTRTLSPDYDKIALVTSLTNIGQLLVEQESNELKLAERLLNEGKTFDRCDGP